MTAQSTESAQLDRLDSIEEIRALVFNYGKYLDLRDLKSYAALFTADGTWTGRAGHAQGPAAIQAMLEERLDPNPPYPGNTTLHFVGEPEVLVDGDHATSRNLWALLGRDTTDAPELILVGHYEDNLVREDGHWKFAIRRTFIDMPAQEGATS